MSITRRTPELAIEIERKFLVVDRPWKSDTTGQRIRQGYLSLAPSRTVRVRVMDNRAWLTIKGAPRGLARLEFEYEIPVGDATILLEQLCPESVIEKTRYRIQHDRHVWEVDEFHGANQGLVVAEIELESENDRFKTPSWAGREVSDDRRYANSSLVRHPYSQWE
jgi:adenylate cyclase